MTRTRTALITTALLALGLATAAAAQTTYQVTVDTSAINGTTGNVDFQFNPSGGAAAATTTVTGFTPAAGLTGSPTLTGGASGMLPGAVTLTNSTGFNDYFQGYTFGNTLTFDTTLSGPALTPPAGTTGSSTFAFSLYDSTGTVPLLTNSPGGEVADITVNADGSITTTAQPNASGGPSVATITAVVGVVPEPSGLLPMTFGLLGLGMLAFAAKRRMA